MKSLFLFFILLSLSTKSIANDTTFLYQKRLQSLQNLFEWLSKKPIDIAKRFDFDSTSAIWKSYDTAIDLYFDKYLLDSIFLNHSTDQNASETPLFKLQWLKNCINSLHSRSMCINFTELNFKRTNLKKRQPEPIDINSDMQINSITEFIVIHGKIYDGMIFLFEENITQLIGIDLYGYREPESKIIDAYYNKLFESN